MKSQAKDDLVVTRLCAMWALTEVSLGGLFHAMRIPLTGLLVGTTALACMYLIARSSGSRATIWKSLLVVASIKLVATPHASPFAYVAMFVQALCMVPLTGDKGQSRGWVVAMFMLASLYSPVQKLALLYITFGSDGLLSVVSALHDWLNPPVSISELVAVPILAWFGIHLAFGYFAARWLHRWVSMQVLEQSIHDEWKRVELETSEMPLPQKRRITGHILTAVATLVLIGLYVYESRLPNWVHFAWRPLLILIVWQLVAKPLVRHAYSAMLKRSTNRGSMQEVVSEMPRMWSILTFAGKKSSHLNGWLARAKMFLHVAATLAMLRPTGGLRG